MNIHVNDQPKKNQGCKNNKPILYTNIQKYVIIFHIFFNNYLFFIIIQVGTRFSNNISEKKKKKKRN